MFRKLLIKNFRTFRTLQSIPLRPITLIYGPNSNGKSSLIKSLLLLKQTVEQGGANAFPLAMKGNLVDLGNFKELVYGHDTSLTCEVSAWFDNTEKPKIRLGPFSGFPSYPDGGFGIDFGSVGNDEVMLKATKLYLDMSDRPAIVYEPTKSLPAHSSRHFWRTRIQRGSLQNQSTSQVMGIKELALPPEYLQKWFEWLRSRPTSKEAFQDDIRNWTVEQFSHHIDQEAKNAVVQLSSFVPYSAMAIDENRGGFGFDLAMLNIDMGQRLEQNLAKVRYLGPIRALPERLYVFSGNIPATVGKLGDFGPDMLYGKQEIVDATNRLLNAFKMGYEIVVKRLDPEYGAYSIRLIDSRSKIDVGLSDVGTGISQVLPLIIDSVSGDGVIICEQPEIHLHPALQGELGELFRVGVKEFGNQYIIETHSEQIILRIKRLIKEKRLTPKEVVVLYVDKDEDGSECIELRLDECGNFLDKWPSGFFEESFNEIFNDLP